ncbi:uncharacterized protein K452DRAFT_135016 [Aplosporella prunicola CBS 121167]|uniref:Uncharacterized protein n=1 Tax=Aplosporella prunicola CBS 121167 TaxID=1176127 RepID=A0A6A6BRD4_9PEZI|nr:uncharacterized protein K452DRAFT_135016 [Aplosporella prunicola CBS 121167]KAF2145131.1 hypothetical protein K452DRAFT_135016 [Aplosporella prunicola CBS 121167]
MCGTQEFNRNSVRHWSGISNLSYQILPLRWVTTRGTKKYPLGVPIARTVPDLGCTKMTRIRVVRIPKGWGWNAGDHGYKKGVSLYPSKRRKQFTNLSRNNQDLSYVCRVDPDWGFARAMQVFRGLPRSVRDPLGPAEDRSSRRTPRVYHRQLPCRSLGGMYKRKIHKISTYLHIIQSPKRSIPSVYLS